MLRCQKKQNPNKRREKKGLIVRYVKMIYKRTFVKGSLTPFFVLSHTLRWKKKQIEDVRARMTSIEERMEFW